MAEENVKLFVGQVPKHMTESQLVALFGEFAIVDEVNVIKDKTTGVSRGCCFVMCPSRDEADKVVNAWHNTRTLPGASSPLQVKYADGERERLENKLFVGMLPKNVTETQVWVLFSQYGCITDLHILRGSLQTSKGCAFLKYETKEQAVAALEAVNGKQKLEGSSVPLVVKWADSEKERQARKAQKAHSKADSLPNSDSTQCSSYFGAFPMSYVPPYNGYDYQAPGAYGLLQYRFPTMQNQHVFQNLFPPVNQVNTSPGLTPNSGRVMAPRNYIMHMGSAYPAIPGVHYRMPHPRGTMTHQDFNSTSVIPAFINGSYSKTPGVSSSSRSPVEGPVGANLFIYHIPQEFGDTELAEAFQSFGNILSARVFVDKATGASKCFGFVSYDTSTAAQEAISMMNGHQLGGKKLKVQLKRDNKQA